MPCSLITCGCTTNGKFLFNVNIAHKNMDFDDCSKVYIKFVDVNFKVTSSRDLITRCESDSKDQRHLKILSEFTSFILLFEEGKYFALGKLDPRSTVDYFTSVVVKYYPAIQMLHRVFYDQSTEFTYGFCHSNARNFIRKVVYNGAYIIGTNREHLVPELDYIRKHPW